MRTIRNRTTRPLQVHLPGGKVLHLGPGRTGQVSDRALDRASVATLLERGELEFVGGEDVDEDAVEPASEPGGPHESTHGHPPMTVVQHKGNR